MSIQTIATKSFINRKDEVQITGGIMKIGLLGMMFLIFLTLKLTSVIAWSWWWVTAPLWVGPAALVFIVLFGAYLADKS